MIEDSRSSDADCGPNRTITWLSDGIDRGVAIQVDTSRSDPAWDRYREMRRIADGRVGMRYADREPPRDRDNREPDPVDEVGEEEEQDETYEEAARASTWPSR